MSPAFLQSKRCPQEGIMQEADFYETTLPKTSHFLSPVPNTMVLAERTPPSPRQLARRASNIFQDSSSGRRQGGAASLVTPTENVTPTDSSLVSPNQALTCRESRPN